MLILKGVPCDKRGELWYISSGAKKEHNQHKNYYSFISSNFPLDIPLLNEKQIDLDVTRTVSLKSQAEKDKMKRILLAYTKRNTSIGYVQGFNFILAKLMQYISDEEKLFWTFTMIIENILPINYYSEMAGVMSDVDLFICIIEKFYFPNMSTIIKESAYMYLKNVFFQWFLTLFTVSFNTDSCDAVWDVMFLEKSEAMFKAAVTMIKLFKDDLLRSNDLDGVVDVIQNKFAKYVDVNNLKFEILLKKYNFDQKLIELNRNSIENMIIVKINKTNENKIEKLKEKNIKKKELCNILWPFCVYGSEENFKVIRCLVLKSLYKPQQIENYFSESRTEEKSENNNFHKDLDYESILIERKHHECGNKCYSQCNSLGQSIDGTQRTQVRPRESGFKRVESSNYDETKGKYKNLRKKMRCLSSNRVREPIIKSGEKKKDEVNKVKNFEAFFSKINFKYNLVSTAKNYNIITTNLENESKTQNNMCMSLTNIDSNFML